MDNKNNSILEVKDLCVDFLQKEVSVKGIALEVSLKVPKLERAAYKCNSCGEITKTDDIKKPKQCNSCQKKDDIVFLEEGSTYINYQEIVLAQMQDDIGGASRKDSVAVELEKDLVDTVEKDNIIVVTGELYTSNKKSKVSKIAGYVIQARQVEKIKEIKPILQSSVLCKEVPENGSVKLNKIEQLVDIIKTVGERHPGGKAPMEEVFAEALAQQIDRQHVDEIIAKMRRMGVLLKPDNDHIKVV